MVQLAKPAVMKDVQIMSPREVPHQLKRYAAMKVAQTKQRKEESAQGMGQFPKIAVMKDA